LSGNPFPEFQEKIGGKAGGKVSMKEKGSASK
jgi:hypothetical protein